MKQWFFDLVEHFKTNIWEGVSGSLLFWAKGVLFFVLISSVLWFLSDRGKSHFSFRALFAYLFPKKLYADPTMRVTYWHMLWSHLFWGPVLAVAVLSSDLPHDLSEWLAGLLGPRHSVFASTWANVAIQTSALVLSSSFATYWLHYATHKVPLLWSIHRVHHSAEALALPAVAHTHPIENILFGIVPGAVSSVVSGTVLYLTGADNVHPTVIAIIAFYGAWEVITGIFEHAHVPFSFGWLSRIFYAPVLHQIHHSAELRHRDKNLGNAFRLSIWDWMFGTLYIPEKGEQYRWGLNDQELGANNPHLTLRDFYLEPFRYAWGVLRNRARGGNQLAPAQITGAGSLGASTLTKK